MIQFVRRYWFLMGLWGVFVLTLADSSGTTSNLGRWLKSHYGPETVIITIFFLSGLLLDAYQIKDGLSDFSGTFLALLLLFIIAPAIASLMALMPLDRGLIIGLIIVAVMPSTLSSGVVMTAAAGGSMAHALFTTILSNALAMVTIPVTLALLVYGIAPATAVEIDAGRIMLTLGFYVLLPLFSGMVAKRFAGNLLEPFVQKVQMLNQVLVLVMIWMGISQTRSVILAGGPEMLQIVVLSFVFHAIILAVAFLLTRAFGMGKGRRESVIFMGGQKTLPLSIIIQVSIFPQYGLALVFCVIHHVVHLMMDSYLVGRLRIK